MPVYKGVEVWIEDSQHHKVKHQGESIDLIDDRTVTAKMEMSRDESFTVHCLSPVSVFCDVFVTTSSLTRKHAARFCLDKTVVTSKDVSGSSENHATRHFKEQGLRTPKRQFKQGKLGSIEVEIRRIGEIVKSEPREGCDGDGDGDGDEEDVAHVSMIDDFVQHPWLLYRFDINGTKGPSNIPAPIAKRVEKPTRCRTLKNRHRTIKGSQLGSSITEGSTSNDSCEYLHNLKRRHRRDGSVGVDEGQVHAASDQLQEYRKEDAEERRLMRTLRERLQAKKTRNMELRRLLGES